MSNTTTITTTSGSFTPGSWTFSPSTLEYTGNDGSVVMYPQDTIITKSALQDNLEEKIEKYLEEHPLKPVVDRLDTIIKKLEVLDKKYLNNAMKDELKEIMSEIDSYREGSNGSK